MEEIPNRSLGLLSKDDPFYEGNKVIVFPIPPPKIDYEEVKPIFKPLNDADNFKSFLQQKDVKIKVFVDLDNNREAISKWDKLQMLLGDKGEMFLFSKRRSVKRLLPELCILRIFHHPGTIINQMWDSYVSTMDEKVMFLLFTYQYAHYRQTIECFRKHKANIIYSASVKKFISS